MPNPGLIVCTSCRKAYRWKPELAGKRVKCPCGVVLTIPASDPSQADDPNDIYGLAEDEQQAKPRKAFTQPSTEEEGHCPYCAQPLEAGATLCVYCGSELKTNAAAVPTAASAPIPSIRPKPAPRDDDELYRMGAKQVIAFGAHTSLTVAVELPSDAPKRKELFDWQKKWHHQMNREADVDKGQKWLVVAMPL